MAGLTITDVKIVGMCSKCRKEGDEIMKDKDRRIYRDDELACVGCAVSGEEGFNLGNEILRIFNNHPVHQTLNNRFELQTKVENKIKEFTKKLEENLIGLFDVYEIKVVNDGNEMTVREHEKKRMIREEINKLAGDLIF